MNRCMRWLVVSLAAAVSACGGGGDDSGNNGFVAPTNDFDARAAWHSMLSGSHVWTTNGVGSDGNAYTVSISVTPQATSVFPVTAATWALSTATIGLSQGSTPVSVGINQTYFDAATDLVVGVRNTSGNTTTCSVVAAQATSVPPMATKVGSSGPLFTMDELDGCLSNSAKVGTSTNTWSVEFEQGTTYFCMNSTERNLAGASVAAESDCVQIAADGTLGGKARISVTVGSFTLVAR